MQGRTAFNYIDRKSTRLNSSHRCISYAVFCRLHLASTLFPYTTLFRSLDVIDAQAVERVRNLKLVGQRVGDMFTLRAIAQSSVEDFDALAFGIAHMQKYLSCKGARLSII